LDPDLINVPVGEVVVSNLNTNVETIIPQDPQG